MKNFDLDLYEKMRQTMFSDVSEWREMCIQCHEEYQKCASHFTKSFRTWYEKEYFHDAILKSVSTTFEKNGKCTICIVLEPQLINAPHTTTLKYKGVTSFSFKKSKSAEVCYRNHEDCLYGEFYHSEGSENSVIHEFFTTNDTFFYIEFEKLTCE